MKSMLVRKEFDMRRFTPDQINMANIITQKVESIKNGVMSDEFKQSVVQTVFDASIEFTPMVTGNMINTAVVSPTGIQYTAPQARRLYYGDSYSFTLDYHPLATSRWLEWTMLYKSGAIYSAISNNARKYINGG